MTRESLDQHIEITPGISGGKPRIAGHRITVENIVIWHERMGKTADEIASDYDVTLADVYAALAYYFDHREEIDQSLAETGICKYPKPTVLFEAVRQADGEDIGPPLGAESTNAPVFDRKGIGGAIFSESSILVSLMPQSSQSEVEHGHSRKNS